MITSLTAHFTRIAVGDCRDGILFYTYNEVRKNCFHCQPCPLMLMGTILTFGMNSRSP